MELLSKLAAVLDSRKNEDPGESYVAALYSGGVDAITAKIAEEATEVVEAARTEDRESLIHETADLWFHTMVLLSYRGLGPEHVVQELGRRFGTSGLQEKAGRSR